MIQIKIGKIIILLSVPGMCIHRGDTSSLKRDNPLYESQEIRMEMFADVSDEETEGNQ